MWKNALVMISRAFESMTDYTYWNLMQDFYFPLNTNVQTFSDYR